MSKRQMCSVKQVPGITDSVVRIYRLVHYDALNWTQIERDNGAGHNHTELSRMARKLLNTGVPLSPLWNRRFEDLVEKYSYLEVYVYSYERRLLRALAELRAAEIEARARLELLCSDEKPITERCFEDLADIIIGARVEAIRLGMEITAEDGDRKSVVSTRYYAASTLMSLAILWCEFAEVWSLSDRSPFDLEFHHIGVDSIETIADVIANSYELFRAVGRDLRYVADEARERIAELQSEIVIATEFNDEAASLKIRELEEEVTRANCTRLAAIDDAAVVAMNTMGLESLAQDLRYTAERWNWNYLPSSSARPFSGIDRKGLVRAAELMRGSYREHALVARNIAYVAIQIKDRVLACEAQHHLAKLLKRDPSEVWSTDICGRTPLMTLSPIKSAFVNGKLEI